MSLTNKDIDEISEMRHLARTDLYFLSRVVLGYKKIDPLVHGPVINHLTSFANHQGTDHISLTSPWKYEPLSQDPIDVLDDHYRRRLILDPRSWFKTTINCVSHTVQWIINFPDIEVFVVHGNIDLSQDIVGKILDHFVNNPRMRRLFPEFCAPIDLKTHRIKQNSLGTKSEFSVACKARKLGSPSVRAGSMGGTSAGQHFHVIKFTDVVNEQNSLTEDQLIKTNNMFDMYENLLIEAGHWIDVEGTCYDFRDLYNGKIIKEQQRVQDPAKKTWKIFVRGCFVKNLPEGQREEFVPEERHYPDLYRCPKHENVHGEFEQNCEKCGHPLWPVSRFPRAFPTDYYLRKMIENPYIHATQHKNNPSDVHGDQRAFPTRLNRDTGAHEVIYTISTDDLKRVNFRYFTMTVDLAEKITKNADFTAMVVCGWDRHNRAYVVDAVQGKFLPEDSVRNIIQMYRKWRCIQLGIEESSFNRGLYSEFKRRMNTEGIWINFQWLKRETGESKAERILCLQPFYKNGLIRFSEGLSRYVQEQFASQFSEFPAGHDDLLDALADQFQGKVDYGDLGERETTQEYMRKAQQKMLQNYEEFKSIYGVEPTEEETLWSRIGAL